MMDLLFTLGGAAAGVVQTSLLARAVQSGPSPAFVLARMLLVGAVLFLSARAGHIVCGTLGWTAGFVATFALEHWRLR